MEKHEQGISELQHNKWSKIHIIRVSTGKKEREVTNNNN